MFNKKKLFTKAVALAALGVVLATGSASAAARQNTTHFDQDLNLNLRKLCNGTVGAEAKNATQEITSRVAQHANGYCPVYFVHKSVRTGKYVTIGTWIRSTFGKCNSKYLSNSGVTSKIALETYSKTMKNANSGATTTSIRGTVKY